MRRQGLPRGILIVLGIRIVLVPGGRLPQPRGRGAMSTNSIQSVTVAPLVVPDAE